MKLIKELKYEFNQLEPVIDAATMEIHYTKHLAAYATNFQAAIEKTDLANESIEAILKNIDSVPAEVKQAVINNAGGVHNHNLYFEQFTPGGKALADGKLLSLINATFGSIDELIEQLKKAGATRFGSGWSWLVYDGENLKVMSTANQDSPLMENLVPLLGIDVWEHAYYLNYQNRRPDYLAAIFSIIDWSVVEARFNN